MKNAIPKLWVAEFISRILTAVATIYVARVIGVEGYGLVGFAGAVLAYLLVFVRFGSDHIIVRELSRDDALDELQKSYLRTTAIVVRLTFSVAATALLVVLAWIADTPALRNLYLASTIAVFGAVLPVEVYLQAKQKFVAMAGYRIVSNLLNLFLVLLFVRSPMTSWVVPAASGAGVLVGEMVFFGSVKRSMRIPDFTFLKRMGKYLLGQGLPLFGSMLLLLLVGQLTIILVRTFCSAGELGRYVAGYKIYDVGNALLVPTATVLFPKLSGVWTDGDPSKRTALMINGISITVTLSLLLLGFALISGNEVVPFLFGDQFAVSSLYVSILAAALVFRSISMLLANGLVAGGKQNVHLLVTAIFVGINIGLGVALIRTFGALGGALSIVIAYGIELAGFVIAIRDSISMTRLRSVVVRILIVWSAAFVPLFAATSYVRGREGASLVVAASLSVLFGAFFLFLLGKFRIVTRSLIRHNLFES